MAADHPDRLASPREAPAGPSPIARPPGGHRRRWSAAAACVCVILSVAACGGSSKTTSSGGSSGSGASTSTSSSSSAPSGPAKPGGSLTVLESSGYAGDWPTGLDPATNTNGAANESLMNAVFGQLWELQANGHLTPDLATGYTFSGGGKTVTIKLRPGVKFSDGTPFNGAAVVFNWKRDLASPCTCKPILPPVAAITAPSSDTVKVDFKVPNGAFIDQLQDSNFSWVASPAALKKMGENAFKLKPVGAGPFTVASDTLSNTLVLKKNPNYWKSGRPYLDGLTFKTTSGDETALEAMQSGQGDAYEGMSTQNLVNSFKSKFSVVAQPSTSPYDIQLNTKIPPFNDKRARQAIYYATDTQLLDQKLFNNQYKVVQGFTAPGGLFYSPTVPGYPTYDLAKAKALVKQLGGLNINYFTISQPATHDMMIAMQQMWKQAGINATIHFYSLATLIQQFQGKWQIAFQTAGAWDPAGGVGLAFRFTSNSPFSGVHDPKLDKLILGASAPVDPAARKKLYDQAAQYIAQNAYGPFLFPISNYSIAAHGVQGPGLTTPIPSVAVNTGILWEEVSKS